METYSWIKYPGCTQRVQPNTKDFSCIVSCKRLPLKELKDYANDLLPITPDDEIQGYKHVFQTQLTKKTVGERIRGPMGLFTRAQTFIDNDCQLVLNKLHEFYADDQ